MLNNTTLDGAIGVGGVNSNANQNDQIWLNGCYDSVLLQGLTSLIDGYNGSNQNATQFGSMLASNSSYLSLLSDITHIQNQLDSKSLNGAQIVQLKKMLVQLEDAKTVFLNVKKLFEQIASDENKHHTHKSVASFIINTMFMSFKPQPVMGDIKKPDNIKVNSNVTKSQAAAKKQSGVGLASVLNGVNNPGKSLIAALALSGDIDVADIYDPVVFSSMGASLQNTQSAPKQILGQMINTPSLEGADVFYTESASGAHIANPTIADSMTMPGINNVASNINNSQLADSMTMPGINNVIPRITQPTIADNMLSSIQPNSIVATIPINNVVPAIPTNNESFASLTTGNDKINHANAYTDNDVSPIRSPLQTPDATAVSAVSRDAITPSNQTHSLMTVLGHFFNTNNVSEVNLYQAFGYWMIEQGLVSENVTINNINTMLQGISESTVVFARQMDILFGYLYGKLLEYNTVYESIRPDELINSDNLNSHVVIGSQIQQNFIEFLLEDRVLSLINQYRLDEFDDEFDDEELNAKHKLLHKNQAESSKHSPQKNA